jgi:hypothetical protein
METLKKIGKAIWAFLNSKFLGYGIALILIIFIAQTCHNLSKAKQDAANAQQNISALTDTIHKEKLKTGELQFTIAGYIASTKDLEKVNKGLYDEVEKQKGTVINLNRLTILLQQDKEDLSKYIDSLKIIINQPIKVNDTTYLVPWTLPFTYDSTNFDIWSGQTKIGLTLSKTVPKTFMLRTTGNTLELPRFDFSQIAVTNLGTEMISRETQIQLVYGQKYVKGKLVVFANSKYPGFRVVNLEGFTVPTPPRRHWFTGFSVNLGIMPTYDFVQGKPTIVVGPCIGYTIYQWGNK